jgi:hypothetical protein
VRANTLLLLLAGLVMVVTLWVSRKARSVTKTEVNLGRQDEGYERFESTMLSRTVVRATMALFNNGGRLFPQMLRSWIDRRLDRTRALAGDGGDVEAPSFDLVRASVNLMVASILIAFATSMKLPLSTTYVTFMVAMGTSLSDQAWGRESAVYRVSGVLTVIGGWFFTALMAFTVSSLFALAIFVGKAPAVIVLLATAIVQIVRNHLFHRRRERDHQAAEVFNLRKIKEPGAAIRVGFEHASVYLMEVGRVLTEAGDGLFAYDRAKLKSARKAQRRVQEWSNILVANTFKVLRLLQWEKGGNGQRYAGTLSSLQEISESLRDVVIRSHSHVVNHHSPLLESQIAEIDAVFQQVVDILGRTARALSRHETPDRRAIAASVDHLESMVRAYDQNQIARIQRNLSKTRLSILFYSMVWNSSKIARETLKLLDVFGETMRPEPQQSATKPLPRRGGTGAAGAAGVA